MSWSDEQVTDWLKSNTELTDEQIENLEGTTGSELVAYSPKDLKDILEIKMPKAKLLYSKIQCLLEGDNKDDEPQDQIAEPPKILRA